MKKVILYFLIVALYLLTPVCVMGILGTAVTKKYEVDDGYWHIDADERLSVEERKIKIEQLDNEGNKLSNIITLFTIVGLTSFVVATILLVKQKTLMKERKSGT